ncbi:4Fe-4S binding domain protein [Peptococcaceae bacterium CEB3]|nr:4Fe-4S binding domain protein [Peptococcaceae bacterium CEB3]
MSIRIDQSLCTGCGLCRDVCPGGLIRQDERKKAFIPEPRDCWGCAACLKECGYGAIRYFLGSDMGGQGAYLVVKDEQGCLHWQINKNGLHTHIRVNKKEANIY